MTQVMAARETRLCFNALIGKCLSCIPLKEVWVEAEAIQEVPWNYSFRANAGSNFITKTGKNGKLDRETLLTKSENQRLNWRKPANCTCKTPKLKKKLAKSVKPKTKHPLVQMSFSLGVISTVVIFMLLLTVNERFVLTGYSHSHITSRHAQLV